MNASLATFTHSLFLHNVVIRPSTFVSAYFRVGEPKGFFLWYRRSVSTWPVDATSPIFLLLLGFVFNSIRLLRIDAIPRWKTIAPFSSFYLINYCEILLVHPCLASLLCLASRVSQHYITLGWWLLTILDHFTVRIDIHRNAYRACEEIVIARLQGTNPAMFCYVSGQKHPAVYVVLLDDSAHFSGVYLVHRKSHLVCFKQRWVDVFFGRTTFDQTINVSTTCFSWKEMSTGATQTNVWFTVNDDILHFHYSRSSVDRPCMRNICCLSSAILHVKIHWRCFTCHHGLEILLVNAQATSMLRA